MGPPSYFSDDCFVENTRRGKTDVDDSSVSESDVLDADVALEEHHLTQPNIATNSSSESGDLNLLLTYLLK